MGPNYNGSGAYSKKQKIGVLEQEDTTRTVRASREMYKSGKTTYTTSKINSMDQFYNRYNVLEEMVSEVHKKMNEEN